MMKWLSSFLFFAYLCTDATFLWPVTGAISSFEKPCSLRTPTVVTLTLWFVYLLDNEHFFDKFAIVLPNVLWPKVRDLQYHAFSFFGRRMGLRNDSSVSDGNFEF